MTAEEAIKELWWWKFGSNPTNFHSKLYDLIQASDHHNRLLLSIAYPAEVKAFEDWQASPDEEVFFGRKFLQKVSTTVSKPT